MLGAIAVVLAVTPLLARYDLVAGPGARELQVEASFETLTAAELGLDSGLGRYVRDLALARGTSFEPLTLAGDSVAVAACTRAPCRIRYRFLLADAAHELANKNQAFDQDGALMALPSAWLLHPASPPPGARFGLQVRTPPGITFVSGIDLGAAPGSYEADLADLDAPPYSGFGAFDCKRIEVPGGVVDVALHLGDGGETRAQARLDWVRAAAVATSGYFGRLPLPRVLVVVLEGGRRPIGYGTTMGGGGASIVIWVARTAMPKDFGDDWVLTHEMTHLALPNVPRSHLWFEEGLATYVEPIARARAGTLSVEEMWRGLAEGLPRAGTEPLDGAHGIGPLYWGGALFHFLADLEIRERTNNRLSLDDALRGVLAAGGSISVSWPLERVLAEGDQATGVPVLHDLYARLGTKPRNIDLAAIWRRLGITLSNGQVHFDDTAPLAAIRKSITAPAATPRS